MTKQEQSGKHAGVFGEAQTFSNYSTIDGLAVLIALKSSRSSADIDKRLSYTLKF
jgi:hypothetical protein